jgi:hypothetical protein
MLRTASTLTSSVCWPPPGSDSESLPLRIQMITTLMMHAMKNITVYQGIALSAVYGPKAASGVDPNQPSTLSHTGFVYFSSKLSAA